MPVDYGSYQIDPMAGFNQGLANIGQALYYRQQMERQTRQETQGAETARLSQTLSRMGIEEAEATRGALSNLYSTPGEPPLDLAGTIQARMAEEQTVKKETQRNARIKFLLDIHESLGGSDENKTEVMKGIIGKDPDPDIQAIAKNLRIKGKKLSFTREITEDEIVKDNLKNPDGSRALAGIYDVEGEATDDPANPFRITGAKMRVAKEFAPQLTAYKNTKTGKVEYLDANKKEDIAKIQTGGYAPYEKPGEAEKNAQNFILPDGQVVLSYDGGRTYVGGNGKTYPMNPAAIKVPGGATLGEVRMGTAQREAQKALQEEKKITISPEKAALAGTGPYKRLATAFEAVAGGLGFDLLIGAKGIFPGTADAKQYLRTIKQIGKAALMNSSRGAIWEQQRIDELFPDPDKTFTNPRIESRKFGNLRDVLLTEKRFNNQAITQSLTPQEVDKYRSSNNEIERLLALIEKPVKSSALSPEDDALIKKYLK